MRVRHQCVSPPVDSGVSTNRLDDLVEFLKEPRPVALLQRWWPAGDFTGASQLFQEVAGRHGLADVVIGEGSPGCPQDPGAGLDAAARERDIGRDDYVQGLHVLDDPIVGGVESTVDDFERDPRLVGSSHPRVGHQRDLESVPTCDAVDLLFHWTGIGIDIDVQQMTFLDLSQFGFFGYSRRSLSFLVDVESNPVVVLRIDLERQDGARLNLGDVNHRHDILGFRLV